MLATREKAHTTAYFVVWVNGYVTEDPIRDGLNWYIYCDNNPITFKDPTGKMKETDGQYNYETQKQLLSLTVDYNNAKLAGDTDGMKRASESAEELRKTAPKDGNIQLEASLFNTHLIGAFAKARALGLEEGSLEFGCAVTISMMDAVDSIDAINRKAEDRMMMLGFYLIVFNGNIFPENDLKVNVTYNKKIDTKGDPNSVMQQYDSRGRLNSERYYDSNGRAIGDIDYTNHGNPKMHPNVPHTHVWNWSDPNKPKRSK